MGIFIPPNRCGFCVDISDPRIRERYEDFKRRRGLPPNDPISDAERFEFEAEITHEFMQRYPERYEQIARALGLKKMDE